MKQANNIEKTLQQASNQNPFPQNQNQQFGNIQPGPSFSLPNGTLVDLDFYEELGGQQIEMLFNPSNLVEMHIDIDHKFQKPNSQQIRGEHIERSMEDFVYLLQNKGVLGSRPNIQFGSQVEERSGSESEIDSYYFQSQRGVNVMTIEGENITESSIINTAKDLVDELKYSNLL